MTDLEVVKDWLDHGERDDPPYAEISSLRARCEAAEAEVLKWKESHAANVDVILSHAALILHHKARSEMLEGMIREIVAEWERDLDGAECCFPLYHRARAALADEGGKP